MYKSLENVLSGKKLYEELMDKYFENSANAMVFLFSEYEELNFYTLYFLPVIKVKKNISKFIIVSPFDEAQNLVKNFAKIPYEFVFCSMEDAYCITRFCQETNLPEFESVYINSDMNVMDNRFLELIGYKGISYKEIVSKGVFKFKEIPTEEEILSSKEEKSRIHFKKIDWFDVKDKLPKPNQKVSVFPEPIREELDILINRGSIDKKDKIIVFSVTKTSRYIIEYLKDYKITAVLDNNEALEGTRVNEIPVYLPESFLNGNHCEDYKIIVPTRSHKVICEQLYYLGYELGEQVFVTYRGHDLIDAQVNDFEEAVKKGKVLYQAIRENYPETKLYLCPYPGTGDIYLIGMYLKERMKYDNVSECVIVVTSQSCKKIFELFGFDSFVKEVVVLNGGEEGKALLKYARGIGCEKANLSVLNSDFNLVDLRYFSGYQGINFNTLFQKTVFHSKSQHTYIEMKRSSSDEIFLKYDLKKGKTILISPYANTTRKNVPIEIWESLTEKLNEAGYTVCTNVSDSSEQVVKGTIGVFIPYHQILDFLEKAGGFIGYRSGLCDIIASTSAKKVILYPVETFYKTSCSYYDYFSLEKMGFATENLYEKEFVEEEWDVTLNEIMKFIAGYDK